jgi:hypothetical protein
MHDPIAKTGAWVKQMLKGHLNYFAVSGNHPSLWWFFDKVKQLWLASLKRRSQRHASAGSVQPVRRPLLSANQNYTAAALLPLRRQDPEGGAQCVRAHAGIGTGAAGNGHPYRDHWHLELPRSHGKNEAAKVWSGFPSIAHSKLGDDRTNRKRDTTDSCASALPS